MLTLVVSLYRMDEALILTLPDALVTMLRVREKPLGQV